MANPRVPYFFPQDRAGLTEEPGGPIMVHLVMNVEHWQFDQPMPRTIITPVWSKNPKHLRPVLNPPTTV